MDAGTQVIAMQQVTAAIDSLNATLAQVTASGGAVVQAVVSSNIGEFDVCLFCVCCVCVCVYVCMCICVYVCV